MFKISRNPRRQDIYPYKLTSTYLSPMLLPPTSHANQQVHVGGNGHPETLNPRIARAKLSWALHRLPHHVAADAAFSRPASALLGLGVRLGWCFPKV